MPRPAMSGAEPCTGSNRLGKSPLRVDVGARGDADGAGAGGPEVGQDVAEQVAGHDDVEPVGVQHEVRGEDVDVELVDAARRGSSAAIAATRSSQYGIEIEMPLLLVAEVRCFFGRALRPGRRRTAARGRRRCGSSPSPAGRTRGRCPRTCCRRSRSTRPRCSRARRRSRCRPGSRPASGLRTPGISRTGRRFTYWSKARRNCSRLPHRRHVVGHDLGPADGAEEDRVEARAASSNQSSGSICPCCCVVVGAGEVEVARTRGRSRSGSRGLAAPAALRA